MKTYIANYMPATLGRATSRAEVMANVSCVGRNATQAVMLLALLVACVFGAAAPASANETDQFLMPEDTSFVDLSHMMNIAHYRALREMVDHVNKQIERTNSPESREQYYKPGYLARSLQARFGPGFFEMMDIEDALRSSAVNNLDHQGKVVAHRSPQWVYMLAHLPIDPRNGVLLFQSSTIRVGGVYMGVDKWGHFHDLGNIYFQDYLKHRRAGKSHEEATEEIVEWFSRGPISETGLIGRFASGVESNADLAANYAGFRFYCNLTEPITFNGQDLPPLLVRHGRYWRLNDHVRPDVKFIDAFVSDHWNEALNPGRFEAGLRVAIKRRLRANSEKILAFYAMRDQRPAEKAYYENLATSLRTLNGESYGYLPISDDEATIAACCFETE